MRDENGRATCCLGYRQRKFISDDKKKEMINNNNTQQLAASWDHHRLVALLGIQSNRVRSPAIDRLVFKDYHSENEKIHRV